MLLGEENGARDIAVGCSVGIVVGSPVLVEVGVEVVGFFVGLIDVEGEDVGYKVGRIVSSSVGLLDGISVSSTGVGVTGFAVGILVGRLVRGFLVGVGVGFGEIEGIAVVCFSVGLMVGTFVVLVAHSSTIILLHV